MSNQLTPIQDQELANILEKQPETEPENHNNGLSWPKLFCDGNPYAGINWEIRTAKITKGGGEIVFEQKDVEVPDFWSQTATDIVASKYFRGQLTSPEREHSARQMIDRVGDTIAGWGLKDQYFKTIEDYYNFRDDLKYLLISQYAAFNSPVWFNVGVREIPQCSACFILSVEDTMQSILDWYRDEGWIFKGGSGSGTNLSKLRSSKEPLSKGGYSSGPVSFMKGADGVANSIRSGGTTRRAAKMVILNADHPDIKDFIYCKKHIEDMTKVLEASGLKASIEGELFNPYTLLPFQNANNSVRVTDDFMQRVESDDHWDLKAVTTGKSLERIKARDVMGWISDAAWHSADPGMQFDTIINDWNTTPNSGRINASNPCSEFMSIDNTACNLASINLLKLLNEDGSFDHETYKKIINTLITAQEIVVDNSSYPTLKITQNAHDFRQLGLGFANIGTLLMSMGLAYDSEEGRNITAAITSILSGEAYLMSSKIAAIKGPFAAYNKNLEPMLRVIRKHASAAENLASSFKQMSLPLGNGYLEVQTMEVNEDLPAKTSKGSLEGQAWQEELMAQSMSVWQETISWGERYGFRNSQISLLAPTGTIAFLMDCQTTGIEPELALVKYKKLVGGGVLKLVNNQVPTALTRLGYSPEEIQNITNYIIDKETIEGAPGILEKHLSVFDCSFKPKNGTRSINYMGHIRMMGAVQPFISGAISKTVNLPTEATEEDIRDAYMQAWRHGLKSIAIYRDGCKSVQPLNTSANDKTRVERIGGYTRIKLPEERNSITHRFSINNHKGYLTVGLYPDTNKPGETFITIAKEGSTLSGLFDVIATLTSICLQSGVPLKTLVQYFKDSRFEPSGFTSNSQIPVAKSFVDYIFRYLGYKFLNEKEKEEIFGYVSNGNGLEFNGTEKPELKPKNIVPTAPLEESNKNSATDAPFCEKCGTMMFRAGSCFSCPNCFNTTGVCN